MGDTTEVSLRTVKLVSTGGGIKVFTTVHSVVAPSIMKTLTQSDTSDV